jgi:autotransporter-associated beta strand protein
MKPSSIRKGTFLLSTGLAAGASIWFLPACASAATGSWVGGAIGNWDDGSKWTSGTIPNAPGDIAQNTNGSGGSTMAVTVNVPVSAGQVRVTNGRGWFVNAGDGSLTLDNTGGSNNPFGTAESYLGTTRTVAGTLGFLTVNQPVILANSDLLIHNNSPSGGSPAPNVTINGGITGPQNITLKADNTALITLQTGEINNTGTITNSGTGTGAVTIGAPLGANVTSVTQASDTSLLHLSGGNTFAGGVTVSGKAALQLSNSAALGTGTLFLKSTQTGTAATVIISGGITLANPIEMDSTTGREWIRFSGAGDGVGDGATTITGNGGNALVIESAKTDGGTATWNGDITGPTFAGSISLRGAAGQTGRFNGVVAIASNLDHNGGGNWVVNAAGSDYVGTRFQNQGNIILGGHDGLDTSARVNWSSDTINGDLDLNGFNASVAGLDRPTTTSDPVVTNNGAADSVLTLAALEASRSFAGRITDGATNTVALVLDSPGRTQTFTGIHTYTGPTSVKAGALALAAGSLTSPVTVAAGAVLGFTLNSPVVSSAALTLDPGAAIRITGTPAAPGYTLISAASITGTPALESAISGYELVIDGTDLKLKATTTTGGFASWITGTFANGNVPADQQGPADDPDNDGIENLLEFALNGDPTASDPAILPALDASGSTFFFTFTRREESAADTTQIFQYGSDLDGWTDVIVPAASATVAAATITVTDNGTTETVEISIPKTEAAGTGKLFGRLKVSQP